MSRDIVDSLISEAAANCGYMIYESGVLLKGVRSHISVKIDSFAGIAHADCEAYSRELDRLLEESGVLPDYSLEISSPGIERKLRTRDEFVRFADSRVKVVFETGGERSFVIGKLLDVTGDSVIVEDEKGSHKIEINSISSANIEF